MCGGLDVVESNHRYLVRYGDLEFIQSANRADRQRVSRCEYRSRSRVRVSEDALRCFVSFGKAVPGFTDGQHVAGEPYARFLQRLAVAFESLSQ